MVHVDSGINIVHCITKWVAGGGWCGEQGGNFEDDSYMCFVFAQDTTPVNLSSPMDFCLPMAANTKITFDL